MAVGERFTDPATGRPYEVGPDGTSRWVDERPGEPAARQGRPWYRKLRYVAPLAAVAGFAVASAGGDSGTPDGSAPLTSASPATAATVTATTTATVPGPATTVTATERAAARTATVTAKPATVRVTVTRTLGSGIADTGGGSGGGSGSGPGAFYANCSEARAAGDTPLFRGDPGYRAKLDRDGDGVACE